MVTNGSRYHEISFAGAEAAPSTIDVIDVHGRQIETIFSGVTDGTTVRWSSSKLASGMYFVRLTRPEGVEVAKIIAGY